MHPMKLLDDVCHLESRFGLFRNSVSFGATFGHGLRLMHHSLRNHFGSTCWYFGEEAQEEARFELFGDSVNLDHSFKYPAIATAIARYSLLRQNAAICVYVQFSRYIPL